MSEKENSLLDLRNVVENINLIHLPLISFLNAGSSFGPERYLKEFIDENYGIWLILFRGNK